MESNKEGRLILKLSDRMLFVSVDEIDCIESEGNYIRVYVGPNRHLIRETMANMEANLDMGKFVRINRSVIVNISRIMELRTFRPHGIKVMTQNKSWNWGRQYRDNLKTLMGKHLAI